MALISFDLDGVLQKNPFAAGHPQGVFGRLKAALAPYVAGDGPTQAPQAAHVGAAVGAGAFQAEATVDAATVALRRIYGEHQARLAAGELVKAYDWDEIVNKVAADLGSPHWFDVVRMVEEGCEVPGLIWSYPGAADCLQALTAAGHTVVSITNGYKRYQEPVMRKLGLLPYLRAMYSPESTGFAKPQPGIYRAVAAEWGGPGIHIGDTLLQDVAGARAAGFQAIYICQIQAPDGEELPVELAALAPWERPAKAVEWLSARRTREMRFDHTPAAALADCLPHAIVARLDEVPATVDRLLQMA
jgi:putative hydrolase of the HAD superfamily